MTRHRVHYSLIGKMPHRRGVRRAGLVLLILGLLLTCVTVYLTRPRRLAELAGRFLTDLTGAQAHIETAWIRFDGTVELQNVTLTVPGMSDQAGRLFEAQTVMIRHHILSLLQGRFEARNLTFINPVLYLARDAKTDKFNFESLRAVRNTDYRVQGTKSLTRIPQDLPNIFIRNGQIILGELAQGKFKTVGNSHFNGSLSSDTSAHNLYYFALREMQSQEGLHPFLAGYLNIQTLEVEASLKGLDFDEPAMRNLLPTPIRTWWDQLAPTGKVPNVRIGYDPDPSVGLFGVLDVSDVALTLPYTENKSRMTVHSGRFKVSGQQIQIENLIGTIEDFTYKINGTVHGLSPDAPFTLKSQITGKITAKPRYAPWFGEQVRKAFEDLAPVGDLEVSVGVERATPNGPFSYKGNIDIRNASICYNTFPYPLTGVRGLIRFDDQKIELINFRGRGPSGTQLSIKCTIVLEPSENAGVTAEVAGLNLPIDDYLYNALAPKHRHLIDNLFSHDHYASLTDEKEGLIASTKQHQQWIRRREQIAIVQADPGKLTDEQKELLNLEDQLLVLKLQRPIFDLGGRTNMFLTLKRNLGETDRNIINARYELQGVNVLLKGWPYPMKLSGGVFTLDPEGGVLDDALMSGVRGGEAVIHGRMYWKQFDDERKLLPEIKFTGSGFPVDDVVISSLGQRGHGILTSLGITAAIDAAGMVLADDDGQPYPALQIHVRNGTVQPFDGQYHIEDLQGYIAVHDKDVQITEITGKNGDATFKLTGTVPEDEPVDISFVGEKIALTPQVLDLIPPSTNKRDVAHRIIDPLQLAGQFDMDLRLFSQGHQTPWQSELRLSPRHLTAVVKGQPIQLTQMQGHVQVDGDQILLHDIGCQYGTGKATVSGVAELANAGSPKLALKIDASSDHFCEVTRAILPQAVVKSLDALRLDGGYHLEQSQLTYQPRTTSQEPSFSFKGQVHLDDARATLGVPITKMNGTMDIDVTQSGEQKLPLVKMKLNIDKLLAADRLISPLTVHMDNNASQGQVLFIQQFSGHCYNGLLHGQGQIAMDETAAFMVRLTLQNADYEPMISPRGPLSSQVVEDALVRPTLSADLTISGMEQQGNTQRSGRGSIAIRNASIYRFPLTMSIVQLLNLATPTARQFNDADVQFLIDNDIINIEQIELISPTINITGSGSLRYSDQALNLEMFTRNPGAPNLGPVTELMKMFKNELVGIHVGGTLENPVTTIKSLGGIRNTMSEILGKPSENRKKPSQSNGDESPSTSGQ